MIYFVQIGARGPVKIGYTAKPDIGHRVADLQTVVPWPLRVIGSCAGTLADERALHDACAGHRIRREWFRPHPTVLACMGAAMAGQFERPAARRRRIIGRVPRELSWDLKSMEAAAVGLLLGRMSDTAFSMIQEMASTLDVGVVDVLVEAARDGLMAAWPQWQRAKQGES